MAASKPLDWLERELIDTVPGNHPGAGRKVYPGFLQHMAFVAMNPARHLASHLHSYCGVSAGDSEAADYYLETVRALPGVPPRSAPGRCTASPCARKTFGAPR